MTRNSPNKLGRQASIVGIGATEFSRAAGRSELQLAVEATQSALADAGLTAADVDGMCTFSMDTNPEIYLAQALGMKELTFFSRVHYGGGATCAVIQQAAMAVSSGAAEVVVCYRSLTARSGIRFGSGAFSEVSSPTTENTRYSWLAPFGLRTPAGFIAIFAQRYLYERGATTDAFGEIALACRKHASTNPKALFFGRPITMEDYQASRWIAQPLRLLDCCMESDGAQAIIVTTTERARDLRCEPVVVAAVAQGSAPQQHPMTSYYREDIASLPEMRVVGEQLWKSSGLKPSEIDAAILYDHFTPLVLMQLEDLDFCGKGEAPDFVSGGNIQIGGQLPINPHGGQLGEAYLHGMNGIAEAVRQIRGAAVNQIDNVENVLVTAAATIASSGMIVTRDR